MLKYDLYVDCTYDFNHENTPGELFSFDCLASAASILSNVWSMSLVVYLTMLPRSRLTLVTLGMTLCLDTSFIIGCALSASMARKCDFLVMLRSRMFFFFSCGLGVWCFTDLATYTLGLSYVSMLRLALSLACARFSCWFMTCRPYLVASAILSCGRFCLRRLPRVLTRCELNGVTLALGLRMRWLMSKLLRLRCSLRGKCLDVSVVYDMFRLSMCHDSSV